ncbi:MAG: hypothetical protein KDK51_04845 [Deltaproteobacteria bacterium]|nr:hypothetical protein [Deltaproteobacteria bacterium]
MHKVYRNVFTTNKMMGFEPMDFTVLLSFVFGFVIILEMPKIGLLLAVLYVLYCQIMKKRKPVGWLKNLIKYHSNQKYFSAGGNHG